MQEYNMLVTYKPGDVHLNADFFSRIKQQDKGPIIIGIVEELAHNLTDDEVTKLIE